MDRGSAIGPARGPGGPPDFGRAPFIVICEATRACALACAHCRASAIPDRDSAELGDDEVRALMDHVREEFGPVLFVVTGGDPLERPGLADLVRHGDRIGLRMAITPSATPLLTGDALAELKDAGIRRVALSLDGADAATHDAFRGFAGTFDRTVAALEAARRLGLETQINSSIGRHNRRQIRSIADLGAFLDISLWSVFILVPTGRADAAMLMSAADHERCYRHLAALRDEVPFDVKTTAGQPYYRVLAQKAAQEGRAPDRGGLRAPRGVNDGNGFAFVDHLGTVQASGVLAVDCGNVRERSLASIYRDHELFRGLRDPDGFAGKCGVCEYRRICGGSRSRAWGLTGDPLASDPTCVYQPKREAVRI